MDRRKFLRGVGIGAAAVVVAPIVVAEVLLVPAVISMKGIIVAKARRKGMSGMKLMHQVMLDFEKQIWFDTEYKSKGGGIWNGHATKEKYRFPEIRKES